MEIFFKIIISFIIYIFIYKYIKNNNIIVFLTAIYFYKFYNLEISFIIIIEQLFLIIFLYKLFEYITKKNYLIYKIFNMNELELIKNGKLNVKSMQLIDLSIEKLLKKLEYINIEDISSCTIDNKNKLNIIMKKNNSPIPIIIDSKIDYCNIIIIKKNIIWLKNILIKRKLCLNDIFYAFYYKDNFFIIKNSDIDKNI